MVNANTKYFYDLSRSLPISMLINFLYACSFAALFVQQRSVYAAVCFAINCMLGRNRVSTANRTTTKLTECKFSFRYFLLVNAETIQAIVTNVIAQYDVLHIQCFSLV